MTYKTNEPVDESAEARGVLLEEVERLRLEIVELQQLLVDNDIVFEPDIEGDVQLSANFTIFEFACFDDDRTPVPEDALPGLRALCERVLQPMRERFGVCTISSGFRTEDYNASIGGAPSSYHVYTFHLQEVAAAADVVFRTGTVQEWADMADSLLDGGGGVGRYAEGFLHVDNGERVWRQ